MTTPIPIVRIFISSPGDVNDEREKARRVIDGLQRHYISVTLQPVFWEDLALPATAAFQETIDILLKREPIDIAVFILWSRLGSPLGPQITRRDGSPYRSGTEREFDVMLEAFAQSGRGRPVILAYTRNDESGFRQSLTDCPSSRLEELIAQRKLAESFIREQFKDTEGHNVRAYHSYREPVSFAQRLHTHLRQVLDELLGAEAAPRWLDEPYRGLEVFEIEHAPIFQGRDEETCEVLQRLRDQEQACCAFAVIVGASGSGKSSLARAGVAAALRHHSYDERVKEWRVVTFFPSLGGNELNRSLTQALAEKLPELFNSVTALEDIANGLSKDSSLTVKLSIEPAFARAAESASGAVRILLLVDQFEELWSDRRITDEDRERFLEVLEVLARSGHIAVLATLRSDFYPHAQRLPAFLRLKGDRGHYDLLPPGAAALHRLILEPARLAGLQFEREVPTGRTLDQLVFQDASRDPAALPLLQYALSELYLQRDATTRTLTFNAYESMKGVEGALGKRAAEIFEHLPDEVRAALPEILPLLVTIDIAGEQSAVRRRAPLADVTATPTRRMLTESFIAARFLTTDFKDGVRIASLAHEALLRCWKELAEWVKSNREHLRMRASVEQSHQRWEQRQRDVSLLLPRGFLLEEGKTLLQVAPHILTGETTDYIRLSIAYDESEKRQNRRQRHAVLAGLSLLAFLATMGAIIAWTQREEARNSAAKSKQSEANARTAEVKESEARRIADERRIEAERHLDATQRTLAQIHFERGLSLGKDLAQYRNSLTEFLVAAKTVPQDSSLSNAYRRILLDRLTCNSTLMIPPLVHDDSVLDVTFSPDGTRIVTASGDKTARLWNAQAGAAIGAVMKHDGSVLSVAFSPDGTRVVTGSDDETARLWDAHTGTVVGAVMKHNGNVRSVVFSSDGTRLVTWSDDNTARLWDAETGTAVGAVMEHDCEVGRVAFSPDGKRVLAESLDFTWRLWDSQTGTPVGAVIKHDLMSRSLSFSPNGKRVVTACSDKTVRLWDAPTGTPAGMVMIHSFDVFEAAFSPDGSRVVTRSMFRVQLWDAETGMPVGETMKHVDPVRCVAFSPDGTRVVTVSGNNTQLWDAEAGIPVGEMMKHVGRVDCAAFSPDGTRIVTGSEDKTARLWDAEAGIPVGATMKHEGAVRKVAFNPDRSSIVTTSRDSTARLWDAQTGVSVGAMMQHDSEVGDVEFSPDGKRIVTKSGNETRLWDAETGTPLGEAMQHDGYVQSMAFSRDGTRVVTGSNDQARFWDVETRAPVGPVITHDCKVWSVAFSPDGMRVLTASEDQIARLWDAQAGVPVRAIMIHQHTVWDGYFHFWQAAFSPDGSRLVTGSDDKSERMWNIETGTQVGATMKNDDNVTLVMFNPDGTRILTASEDHTTRLWNAPTGIPVGAIMKHDGTVRSAAFSPDGTRVVSASTNNSRLWDVETGTPVGPVMAQSGFISSVAFSPDGTRVVTASEDGTANLWDVTDPALGDLPRERLDLLFEMMTGCRATSEGTQLTIPIPAEEFLEILRRFGDDDPLLVFQRKRIDRLALGHTLFLSQNAEYRENWFAAAFQLRRLSEMEPDNVDVWLRLGRAYAQQQKSAEAVAAFQSAVRLQPNNIDWTFDLAMACLATRDPDQFCTAAHSLLTLAEKSENASDWDAAAWLLTFQRPDSIAMNRLVHLARQAVEKEPDNWSYRETLGALLFSAGDHTNAIVELEKVRALQANVNPPKGPAADDTADNSKLAKTSEGTVWTNSFLALTHQVLGHADEATRHRIAAERLAKDSASSEWRERLLRDLLQQQLKDVFGSPDKK